MTTPTETAKDLIALAGGPSIVGVGALLAYATGTLSSAERIPRKGWLTLGAGLVLALWLVLFGVLAAPTVLDSWTARGPLEPTLVLLSATWLVAAGLFVVLMLNVRVAVRYLDESYRADERPRLLRVLRRMARL